MARKKERGDLAFGAARPPSPEGYGTARQGFRLISGSNRGRDRYRNRDRSSCPSSEPPPSVRNSIPIARNYSAPFRSRQGDHSRLWRGLAEGVACHYRRQRGGSGVWVFCSGPPSPTRPMGEACGTLRRGLAPAIGLPRCRRGPFCPLFSPPEQIRSRNHSGGMSRLPHVEQDVAHETVLNPEC
jgi:hypothetical protein